MRSGLYWFVVTLALLLVLLLLMRLLSGYILIRALGPLVPMSLIVIPIMAGLLGLATAKRPR